MPQMKESPSRGAGSPVVAGFYERASGSIQYVVSDPATKKAALIDVVRDFDPAAARIRDAAAQEILDYVARKGLEVEWILDTHPHADHLMASSWLKERLGAPTAIGEKVREIAELWRGIYHMPDAFDPEADFDRLFADGEEFRIGSLNVRVMLSPGHTLGSITYVVGDAAFVHDTLMHYDVGSSRADFPGGSAKVLWGSIQRILALPDETRLFVGHDYGAEGAARGRPGRAWSPSTRRTTRMLRRASPRPNSSRCARRVTRRWRCRTGSCTRSSVNLRGGQAGGARGGRPQLLQDPRQPLLKEETMKTEPRRQLRDLDPAAGRPRRRSAARSC